MIRYRTFSSADLKKDKNEKKEEEDFSMHDHIINNEFTYNNKGVLVAKPFDDGDSKDKFESSLSSKLESYTKARELSKTVALPSKSDLERQHHSDNNTKNNNITINQDEIDYETWLDNLKNI